MISDALHAPARSDDAIGTLFVGSVLLVLSLVAPLVWAYGVLVSPLWLVVGPFVALPPLLVLGYEVRVLGASARGAEATPSFVDWAGLVRTGLLSLVLRALYLLPLAVVVAAGVAVAVLAQTDALGLGPNAASAVAAAVAVLLSLFSLSYFAAYLYLRPAALAVFAVTGRLRSALAPRRVLGVAVTRDYAVGWTVAGVVLVLGLLVAAPFSALLVGFALAFYVRATAAVAYGRGAATGLSARGLLGEDEPAGAASPVPVGRDAPPDVQVGRTAGPPLDRRSRPAGTVSDSAAGSLPDHGFDFGQEPVEGTSPEEPVDQDRGRADSPATDRSDGRASHRPD
ncbi:MAG: DUF4013 domain-containing protein [Haloferacaceae archaeon]